MNNFIHIKYSLDFHVILFVKVKFLDLLLVHYQLTLTLFRSIHMSDISTIKTNVINVNKSLRGWRGKDFNLELVCPSDKIISVSYLSEDGIKSIPHKSTEFQDKLVKRVYFDNNFCLFRPPKVEEEVYNDWFACFLIEATIRHKSKEVLITLYKRDKRGISHNRFREILDQCSDYKFTLSLQVTRILDQVIDDISTYDYDTVIFHSSFHIDQLCEHPMFSNLSKVIVKYPTIHGIQEAIESAKVFLYCNRSVKELLIYESCEIHGSEFVKRIADLGVKVTLDSYIGGLTYNIEDGKKILCCYDSGYLDYHKSIFEDLVEEADCIDLIYRSNLDINRLLFLTGDLENIESHSEKLRSIKFTLKRCVDEPLMSLEYHYKPSAKSARK